MKRGFWNFKNGFTVDCTADPYNPVPVARALLGEIEKIRETSNLPIYVLGGEFHNNLLYALVPYAFMQAARLRDTTSQTALMSRFEYCIEKPINLLDHVCNQVLKLNLPSAQLARIAEADRKGVHQVEILKAFQNPNHAPHVDVLLADYLREHGVPVRAVDSPYVLTQDDRRAVVSGRDPHTAGYGLENKISEYPVASPSGVAIRNGDMAIELQLDGMYPQGRITYWQGGRGHLFGRDCDYVQSLVALFRGLIRLQPSNPYVYDYEHSLASRFQCVQDKKRGHVICLLPVDARFSEKEIPAEADAFTGTVIGVYGLNSRQRKPFEDHAAVSQSVSRIFETLALNDPVPHIPRLDYDVSKQRIKAFVDDYLPSLLASVQPASAAKLQNV